MSSVPKRLPDGGTNSLSSVRHPDEDAAAYSNMTLETGEDSQAGKSPFLKSHHVDKRSPSHSMHHVQKSASDAHISCIAAGTGDKPEHKDFKGSRENKLDSRDAKVETRESYHRSGKIDKDRKVQGRGDDTTKEAKHSGFKESRENKMDSREVKVETRELYHRSGKIDKEMKFQGRVDDKKEAKHDEFTYNDSKAHAKPEKGFCGSESGLSSRKEHQRGKTYDDDCGRIGDADWVDKHMHLHGTTTVCKEYPTNNEREHIEANDDMGENEVDLKVDDNDDKDRKRKHGERCDWGQRDKGSNTNSLQFIHGGNNKKEPAREEREDRQDRDRKDVPDNKVGPKAVEKDYVNRDALRAVEKEVSSSEQEIMDRSTMLENKALDQKKPGEVDEWINAGIEAAERRKERDGHVEGERPEKRTRYADKESDDRGADVDAVADEEKGSVTCVAQQRKSALHSRSSPQITNSEAHCRHQGLEAHRLQGENEVASIVYKVGECMQELLKVWKEYEAFQADKKKESCLGVPTLEVKIPGQHITAKNRQVRYGQLWGTDVYTNDSDLVAVLMHMGYCRTSQNSAPPALQDVRVIIRLLPPQDYYISSWRNNVRSRAWGAGIGCSYQVERCFLVKKGCEPCEIERSLTYSSIIEPTLAPLAVERPMTTRAAASNSSRHQKLVKEVTIQYNLCNEPWIKYGINLVADKGLKKPTFTSARLKKGEVLYMETHFHRYELCFLREKVVKAGSTSQAYETETEESQYHQSHAANGDASDADGEIVDVFRFSRCKKNLPQLVMLEYGIPLPVDLLEVLDDNLDWEDVLWSPTGVWIGGKEYKLARIQFLSPTQHVTSIV